VKLAKKPRVYLAGPISGCNDEQRTHWRRLVQSRYGEEFEFLDPAEDLVQEHDAPYQVVERDVRAIGKADAVLANMWRESIGTAMGLVIAKLRHKPVVVADPNRLGSRMLAYYADAVTTDLHEAVKHLRALLRFDPHSTEVVKRDSRRERFDLHKLSDSIREACRRAGRDDLLLPLEVVPLTLRQLVRNDAKPVREVTTTRIRDAVWEVLAQMESEPERHVPVAGVRKAWEEFDGQRRRGAGSGLAAPARSAVALHAKALLVAVQVGKSHGCIWGKGVKSLKDIPNPARAIFEEICRVDGLRHIRLTQSGDGPKEGTCLVSLSASRNPGTIEGKCHDPKAERGRVQHFQVLVHDPERTEDVLRALREHLAKQGLLRAPADMVAGGT
jgi:transcriptional regulator NrdR family protein